MSDAGAQRTVPHPGMLSDISRLTESPGPMSKHPQGGALYHPAEQIISHLNYSLGPDGWDWEELDHGFDEMGDQVWVRGKMTARFLSHADAHEGYKTTTASKIEKGWKAVSRRRSDGTLVNLGDDYKGADTDALKRAARLIGVGLDAWAKDAPAQQSRQQAPPQPQTNEAPRTAREALASSPDVQAAAILTGANPQPRMSRQSMLRSFGVRVQHAQRVGLDHEVIDPATLTDDQLAETLDALARQIGAAQSQQRAV